MTYFQWLDHRYGLGVESIDEQHQEIVDMINRLHDCMQSDEDCAEVVGEVITALANHIKVHFADEEKLMQAIRYPELEKHKASHRQFASQLAAILHEMRRGGGISAYRLMTFIKNWFEQHVGEEDQRIKVAMKRMMAKTAAAPSS